MEFQRLKEQRTETGPDAQPDVLPEQPPAGPSASSSQSREESYLGSATDAPLGEGTAEGLNANDEEPHEERRQHHLEKMAAGSPFMGSSLPPLRLSSIRIEGAKHVRPSFLASVCRPYLDPLAATQPLSRFLYGPRTSFALPGESSTLPGILALTSSLASDLAKFDLLADVQATLEPAQGPFTGEEDVDVIFKVREKSRVFLKSSTDVGNGEGSASVQGRLRNIFGGAETLEGSATFGTRTKQALHIALMAPLFASPDHTFTLSVFALDRDCTSFASAYENMKGARAAVLSANSFGGQHELAYEATWRHIGRMLPDVSVSMRKLGGHNVKSALTHTYVRDTRDDPFMATQGSYLKLVQEYAGLGGDANFVKLEGDSQMSRCFGHGWAYSLAARAGVLRTLNGRPSLFSDRFQLGGPTSVRMFRQNSLGPKEKLDSLGGDAHWNVGASLIAPIPSRPEWPLKLHAFLNAGQLAQIDQSLPLSPSSFSPLLQPSASAGVGLMYRQGALRVELNAGLPLLARKGDGARKGLQLGIGIDFL